MQTLQMWCTEASYKGPGDWQSGLVNTGKCTAMTRAFHLLWKCKAIWSDKLERVKVLQASAKFLQSAMKMMKQNMNRLKAKLY